MALAETAQLAVRIDLEGNASAGIAKLNRQVKGLGASTGRIGKGFGQIGAGIARAGLLVGGAAVTGLAGAAKAAIDFEDAFAGVRKTVDASEDELQALSTAFRTMATEIPIAADEFARIGELGGALGIAAADLEEFTKTVALIGVTTDVSTDDAATALGQLSNVLKLTGDDYDNFASTLVDLGNKGASTESAILEIARRAGGASTLLEIAADKTLGWSSAIANLGIAPELAGSSLQRFFTKSLSIVSGGGAALKEMADIAGTSAKKFKTAFDKDASGALEDFLQGLGKLPKDKRLKAVEGLFGKGSGLTRALLGLAESYDQNLAPSIDTASEAWEKNTALQVEAQKRFDTIRSKLQLLKNNLVEAGITLGEGFTPAIGRAAEKLADFLKQDGNKSQLKALGEDIGKAIDDIDWQAVLDGARDFVSLLKGTLSITLRILDAINKLPTELKAAAAAFLVVNKLSGGLLASGVGNVVGGLAGAATQGLASRAPGIGRLFAQPVFVTNWPLGGLGGAGGGGGVAAGAAKGGLGAASKMFLVGEAIGLAALVETVRQGLSGESTAHAGEIQAGLNASIAGKTLPELKVALAGVTQGITDLQSNPLNALVQGEALTTLQTMQADIKAQIARIDGAAQQASRNGDTLGQKTDNVKSAQVETKRETSRGLSLVKGATTSGASMVASAVRQSRPIITTNVYVSGIAVQKKVVITGRYGNTGGSKDTKPGGAVDAGNLF